MPHTRVIHVAYAITTIRRQTCTEFKLEIQVLGAPLSPRHLHPGIMMSDLPEEIVFEASSPKRAGGQAASSQDRPAVSPGKSPGKSPKKPETPKSKAKSPKHGPGSSPAKKPPTPKSKGKSPMKAVSPASAKSVKKVHGKSPGTGKKGTPKAKSPAKVQPSNRRLGKRNWRVSSTRSAW